LSFHTLKLIWFLTLNKILLSQCLIRNLKMAISEQGKHISKCQIKYAVWHISHYKNRTTLNRWRLSKSLWPHISYVTFHTSFIFIRKTWKIRCNIIILQSSALEYFSRPEFNLPNLGNFWNKSSGITCCNLEKL